MKRMLVMVALCVLGFTNPVSAAVDHKIPLAQYKLLQGLGMKILVPGYVPAGFKLIDAKAGYNNEFGDRFWPHYSLTYEGYNKDQFIQITGISGGLGDAGCDDSSNRPLQQYEDIKPPAGEMRLCFYKDGFDSTLFGSSGPMMFLFNTKGLNYQETKKIIMALAYAS